MNIAMFTDAYYPRINGLTTSVHLYATELEKLGHNVCIVCLDYSKKKKDEISVYEELNDKKVSYKIFRIPSAYLFASKEDRAVRIDKVPALKKAMKEFAPDVIHINSEWMVSYFGVIYATHKKIPVVYTFHTLWEEYLGNYITFLPKPWMKKAGKSLQKFYLKHADIIIAPTMSISAIIKKYKIKKYVEIIPTGISDFRKKYTPKKQSEISKSLYKSFPYLHEKQILLFVGRIVKEKNLSFLLDVLERIHQTNPNTALLFIGGGPYMDEMKKIISKRKLDDSVALYGYAEFDEVIYFYKLAKIFVFPSKTETQGLVTCEAMLAGLPVVAIGEMGTTDIMQGDNGGFMVKDDVMEFAQKIQLLLENDEVYKNKSEEAIEWALRMEISNLTPKLINCYEKAIQIKTLKKMKKKTK